MALNRKRASGEGDPGSPRDSAHGGNAAFATLLAGAVLAATLTAGGCADSLPSLPQVGDLNPCQETTPPRRRAGRHPHPRRRPPPPA